MNFVCLVFELGDKNVNIVTYGKPNGKMQPKGGLTRQTIAWLFLSLAKITDYSRYVSLLFWNTLSSE